MPPPARDPQLPKAPALLPRGTTLGRYEVLRELGVGGMGQVYLARSSAMPGFQKLVALKRVVSSPDGLRDFSTALLQEARLNASLHHPNIAQVYDAGIADGFPFFAMEYIHGESLTRVLGELARRGRGLSLKNALWIVSSVAAGLHYAHEKLQPDGRPWGIVHRDVSPGNIMITFDGVVKVIDFGVAKAVAQPVATRPGTVKGNLRYMSPEQFLGGVLSRQSDLFSLGIVLFELTTGTRWQRERDDQLAVQAMLHAPLPRPSERRAGYPPALEEIVDKALARDASQRYATTRELQLALEGFAQTQGLSLSNIDLGETMRQLFAERARMSTERELFEPITSQRSEAEPAATRVTVPVNLGGARLGDQVQAATLLLAPEAAVPKEAGPEAAVQHARDESARFDGGRGGTLPLVTGAAPALGAASAPEVNPAAPTPNGRVFVAFGALLAVLLVVVVVVRFVWWHD